MVDFRRIRRVLEPKLLRSQRRAEITGAAQLSRQQTHTHAHTHTHIWVVAWVSDIRYQSYH